MTIKHQLKWSRRILFNRRSLVFLGPCPCGCNGWVIEHSGERLAVRKREYDRLREWCGFSKNAGTPRPHLYRIDTNPKSTEAGYPQPNFTPNASHRTLPKTRWR